MGNVTPTEEQNLTRDSQIFKENVDSSVCPSNLCFRSGGGLAPTFFGVRYGRVGIHIRFGGKIKFWRAFVAGRLSSAGHNQLD